MFQRIVNWLSLSPTERRVLLFLAGTLIAGAAIRAYQEAFPHQPEFDYHAADSIFAAYQGRIAADTTLRGDASPGTPLDLNAASIGELMTLPGIGKALAERIVEHRTKRGRLANVEELLHIRGISRKKLDKMKSLIAVN